MNRIALFAPTGSIVTGALPAAPPVLPVVTLAVWMTPVPLLEAALVTEKIGLPAPGVFPLVKLKEVPLLL